MKLTTLRKTDEILPLVNGASFFEKKSVKVKSITCNVYTFKDTYYFTIKIFTPKKTYLLKSALGSIAELSPERYAESVINHKVQDADMATFPRYECRDLATLGRMYQKDTSVKV